MGWRHAPNSVVFVLGLLLCLAAGCASRQAMQADPLGQVPADFTLDVAVITGGRDNAARNDSDEIVPAELRAGRFIVFPNGDLHYARRDIRIREARPPLVRRLGRDEMSQLWSLCEQSGLVSAEAMTMDESHDLMPATGEVAYIMAVQSGGVYHGVARTFDRQGAAQSAEAALVRELAALAWANELPSDRVMVIPKRYDFGPDPYERYRKP